MKKQQKQKKEDWKGKRAALVKSKEAEEIDPLEYATSVNEPVTEAERLVLSNLQEMKRVLLTNQNDDAWIKCNDTWLLTDTKNITREVVLLPDRGWTVVRKYGQDFHKMGKDFSATPCQMRIFDLHFPKNRKGR